MIDIALINASTALTDSKISNWMPEFQAYIDDFLASAWDCPATLHFVGRKKKADPKMWWVTFGNRSKDRSALGYHGTQPNGLPYSFIAAADDIRYGYSVTVTATHEISEMLCDPQLNRLVTIGDRRYIVEVADMVEADELGFLVGNVLCSDFVLPAYYDPNSAGPWDYQEALSGPVPALTRGGYLSYQDAAGYWHQTTARKKNGNTSYRSRRQGGRGLVAAGGKP